MGCTFFPQKLQLLTNFFLVLEEDLVDFKEYLPLEGLVGGLGLVFHVSFFNLAFGFGFP